MVDNDAVDGTDPLGSAAAIDLDSTDFAEKGTVPHELRWHIDIDVIGNRCLHQLSQFACSLRVLL